ncbi:hybrid sensor histidine kinase/response regulator [Nitrosomonas supralitoralis]|uniref:Histidine kinase n=1 Tax=Nitrosomonas supralitoralis TaxID=2116706 RepID=A0A2P7NY63_9PROT|nr:histidine kinase [Nitrosomonas supralitoralis]PSJ18393.1 histidine kinase [Nitrosomonas supralitoralis]
MVHEEKLKILLIEHSAQDAERVLEILLRSGFQTDCLCVATVEDFLNALRLQDWNLILSDYASPHLGAHNVIELIKNQGLDIPVIIISSDVGEETADYIMALGAYDFMMKDNLARLVPVIRRSLSEVKNYQRFISAQAALQKSEALFQAITSNLPGVVFQFQLSKDNQAKFPYVSDASETLLGLSPQKLMGNPELFPALILAEDKESYRQLMLTSAERLSTWNWEGCIQVKGDSDIKWVSLRATPRRMPNGDMLWDGIMINITRNKLAEREIARSREQLAELSSYLQKVKEQERARIAREIHDDIGGTLTAIKCELFPCIDKSVRNLEFYQQKARSVESLVDRVIDSTRRISLDLRPGILDCGIVAAVQWQAKEFSNRTGIICRVSCDSDEISLDADLAIAIFRVFQETLTNISKHANASRIHVELIELEGLILLEVIDDGRGITVSDMEKQDSFGIRGMRERCLQLKGNFHISGESEKGTKVTILIPTGSLEDQSEQAFNLNNKFKELSQSEFIKKRKQISRL